MSRKKKERTIEEVWTQRNSLCCYYDFCLDAAARRNLVSPGCSLCPNRQDKAGPGLGHADIRGCLVLFMMLFEKEIPLVKDLAAQWREEKRLDELEALVDGWRKRPEGEAGLQEDEAGPQGAEFGVQDLLPGRASLEQRQGQGYPEM